MEKIMLPMADRSTFLMYRAPAVLRRADQSRNPDKDDAPDPWGRHHTVWRGDHAFDPAAAAYSFSNIIEPEVTKKNPGWTKDQIRQEAASLFEKRLRQDYAYEQKELSHAQTSVTWRVIEATPGNMELATEYGGQMITLRELWQHTEDYARHTGNPGAYNAAEERSQLAMQDAFIRGDATGFISVLSHPDSIRYVQVWQKTPEGQIESKQIDLYAATGRDFTHEEGDRLVAHIRTYADTTYHNATSDSTQVYAHAYLVGGTIADAEIRAIAMAHALSPDGRLSFPDTAAAPGIMRRGELVQAGNPSLYRMSGREHPVSLDKAKTYTHPGSSHSTRTEKKYPHAEAETVHVHSHIGRVIAEWHISRLLLSHAREFPQSSGAALYWISHVAGAQQTVPDIRKGMVGPAAPKQESMLPVTPGMKRETESLKHPDMSPAKKSFRQRLGPFVERVAALLGAALLLRGPRQEAVQARYKPEIIALSRKTPVSEKKRPALRKFSWRRIVRISLLAESIRGLFWQNRYIALRQQETGKEHVPFIRRIAVWRRMTGIVEAVTRLVIHTAFVRIRFSDRSVTVPATTADPEGYLLVPQGIVLQMKAFLSGRKPDKKTPPVPKAQRVASVSEMQADTEPYGSGSAWILFAIIWYLAMKREGGKPAVRQTGAQARSRAARRLLAFIRAIRTFSGIPLPDRARVERWYMVQ